MNLSDFCDPVETLLQERLELSKELVFRDLVLEKLLRHGSKELPEHMARLLKLAGIEFHSPWFAVLVIRIFELPIQQAPFLTAGSHDKHLLDFDRVGLIVQRAFEPLLSGLGQVLCINMGDGIPCLLNLENLEELQVQGTQQVMGTVTKLAAQAARSVYQQYGIELTVSVSDFCIGAGEISGAYRQAYELSLYGMTAGQADDPVITFAQYQRYQNQQDLNPAKSAHQFYDAVAVGDFAKAEDCLGDMASTELLRHLDGSDLLPCLLRQYIQTALGLFSPPLAPERKFAVLNGISLCMEGYQRTQPDGLGDMDDVLGLVSDLIGCMESALTSECSDQKDDLHMAVNYIQNHYEEPALNVGAVAQRFGFKNAQFSRIFKREIGINPLDYLHYCRINAAKRCLTSTDQPVSQIAQQVGYISSRALIQAFKHYEGMTPGKYRERYLRNRAEGREGTTARG